MMSTKTILVLLCVAICHGGVIERVDKVLQKLALERSLPGLDDSNGFSQFLDHGNQFKNFVLDHDKYYETNEEIEKRFGIFRDNLKTIDRYNKHELGTATYGVTRFADLTISEFNHGLSPVDWTELERLSQSFERYVGNSSSHYQDAKKVNYKEQGKVLAKVQDQHMCGSCWAHSAVATIETAYAIKYNKLIEFSKQQLVDCDYYDGGCCGGWPFRAYDYIHRVGGIMTESDYKQRYYEGPCKFDQKKVKANVDKRYIIYNQEDPEANENVFARFLNDVGPLVAIINAGGFRFYKGGVMNQPDIICDKSTYSLNHAVFNIGFDSETIMGENYPYWIIKNSWGPGWGEDGYIRIAKGHNVCGMGWIATGVGLV